MSRKPTTRKQKQKHALPATEAAGTAIGDGTPAALRPIPPWPAPADRGPGSPVVVSIEGQRSYITNAANMLQQSSLAYLLDPGYQAMMLRDPDVAASLQALVLEISGAAESVEPDDDTDEELVEAADRVAAIYFTIPRRTDMKRNLALASWYGPAAVNPLYVRDPETVIRVADWVPIHPDAIAFDINGNLAMRVGARYTQQISSVNMGINSWVHIFTPEERASIILHRVFVEAPSFDDPRTADQVYRGTGNRDRCWFYWYLKQELLQQIAIWSKRYAAGIRIGRYTSGNDQEKEAVMNALSNLINDNQVVMPRHPNVTPDAVDIEIKEAVASRATILMECVTWLSSKIKEVQQGQSLTSEAHGTGLGSGVAGAHENTKSLFVRYHCDTLAESITRDFIQPVARMIGYPESIARRISLKISAERPNPKERAQAAALLVNMGCTLSMDEVRETAGFSRPKEGEEVLRAQTGDMLDSLLADPREELALSK